MSKLMQLSLVLGLLSVLLISAMMGGLIQADRWMITQLEVSAEYKRVGAEQIRTVIADVNERSFFRVDVNEVRDQLLILPWVKNVHVSKRWPDTLKIKIWEHKAVAIWNNTALLNQNGEIFQVHAVESMSHLPQLSGPENASSSMLADYERLNLLLSKTGVEIAQATMSQRGGWVLVLRNGLEVFLGSEKMDARLLRFADTWDKLIKNTGRLPEKVDLRYTNGYVVHWREQTEVLAQQQDEMVS